MKNPKPSLGDMVKVKDVRMDGSIRSEHVGLIYNIKNGYAMLQWVNSFKPYDYVDDIGYPTNKIKNEYDVFTVIAKVENVE